MGDQGMRPPIPVLRMYDIETTKRFYVDCLGFNLDWREGEGDRPVYMRVSRGPAALHLSSHSADGTPGTAIVIQVDDVEAFLPSRAAGKALPIHESGIEPACLLQRLAAAAVTLSAVASGRPTAEKQAVGRRLAAARRRAGLTQKELAEQLGVNLKSVQAWEGGRASPYRRVEALERVLAIDRNWLLAPPPEGIRDDVQGGTAAGPLLESRLLSDEDLLDVGCDPLTMQLRKIEGRLAEIERRLTTLEAEGAC